MGREECRTGEEDGGGKGGKVGRRARERERYPARRKKKISKIICFPKAKQYKQYGKYFF